MTSNKYFIKYQTTKRMQQLHQSDVVASNVTFSNDTIL